MAKRIVFSESETKTLISMFNKGIDYSTIAEKFTTPERPLNRGNVSAVLIRMGFRRQRPKVGSRAAQAKGVVKNPNIQIKGGLLNIPEAFADEVRPLKSKAGRPKGSRNKVNEVTRGHDAVKQSHVGQSNPTLQLLKEIEDIVTSSIDTQLKVKLIRSLM